MGSFWNKSEGEWLLVWGADLSHLGTSTLTKECVQDESDYIFSQLTDGCDLGDLMYVFHLVSQFDKK